MKTDPLRNNQAMRPLTAITRFLVAVPLALGLMFYPALAIGNPAKTVPFVFTDIEGKPLRLTDYRGQWVLVAFWAPWCPLCKIQIPSLKQLDSRPDLTVIGVGLDYDTPDAVRTTVDEFGMAFRTVAGGKRRDPNSPHHQVGPVDFFPTSYLYDPAGEIAMYIPGQVRAAKVLAFMGNWRAGPVLAAAKTDKLAAFVKQQYGKNGEQAYGDWRRMVDDLAAAGAGEQLAHVNDFFNRRIRQGSDQRVWGRQEYWATLGEVLGKGIGDGEDFALAKYFTLLALNVPAEQLRLVYVKTGNAKDPVHMVLAYFEKLNQEPVLLDNKETAIQPASKRTDLRPVYSFNSAGAWGDTQDLPDVSGGQLPMWEDALRRARNEGF